MFTPGFYQQHLYLQETVKHTNNRRGEREGMWKSAECSSSVLGGETELAVRPGLNT